MNVITITKCPKCGREIEEEWNFCRYCRADLRELDDNQQEVEQKAEEKICPDCGAPNALKNKFCLKCGSQFGTTQATEPPEREEEPPKKPPTKITEPIESKTAPPSEKTIQETVKLESSEDESEPIVEPKIKPKVKNVEDTKKDEKKENEFEYINWIKNHGLRTISEIKKRVFDNCNMLNTYLFQILSEIREYSEWTAPNPQKDKKYLIKYGQEVEEYAQSIDCKKLDSKSKCKSIIQTFIDSLNEAVNQLVALI
ncbi:MAG: zinc-ribbon domain-containing protein [Candidatus Lokiarchaeota archaeon]|nr:zinc-ribbon domain-containing protein [Candidatus Lokiarchaeota archaeon]